MSTRLEIWSNAWGGRLAGDPRTWRCPASPPWMRQTPSHITFLSNPKLRTQAAHSNAAALILSAADDAIVGADISRRAHRHR